MTDMRIAIAEKHAANERDRRILDHLPLVKAIARSVQAKVPVNVEIDDLIHAGILGLIDAIAKYDAEKQIPFRAYAQFRIKGAILDSLRDLDPAPRGLRQLHRKIEAAANVLTHTLQRTPTGKEVADSMGIKLGALHTTQQAIYNLKIVSASGPSDDLEDLPVRDFAGPVETQPDRICERAELRGIVSHAVHTLPYRYQKAITLYYTEEWSMREIAGVLGVNESRVCQILDDARKRITPVLKAKGICSN